MSIELELWGVWEWLAILEAPPTPRSLDFPGHQRAGHPITQGALLPPGTRLRRCGRRGRRRRASSRCNGVGGPGRGVRGGWLHRGRLRRRYVRGRRPRRHQLIRCVRAFARRSGLRRLRRRVDRTGVGCGGILEPGLLGGAALLPGLLEVADGVRVQCELLVLRTSERQELIGGGQRPASKEQGSYRIRWSLAGRGAQTRGRLYRSGAGTLLAACICTRLATARACAFPRASPQERRR